MFVTPRASAGMAALAQPKIRYYKLQEQHLRDIANLRFPNCPSRDHIVHITKLYLA